MFKNKKAAAPIPVDPIVEGGEDPTGWILDNEFANFVLMHTNEIVSGRGETRQTDKSIQLF